MLFGQICLNKIWIWKNTYACTTELLFSKNGKIKKIALYRENMFTVFVISVLHLWFYWLAVSYKLETQPVLLKKFNEFLHYGDTCLSDASCSIPMTSLEEKVNVIFMRCSVPMTAVTPCLQNYFWLKKKIDKQQLERNRLSLFLPTESYSILHLAFRIIAFLTYAQTRDGTA